VLAWGALAAPRFTLSGTVVDASNQPLAGVELTLQTEQWKAVGDPAISDAQGRFAFGGLATGEYILTAEGAGFGTIHYGEAPDPGWVSSVRVGGEAGNKSIVFRIVPRGAIEGIVRDEFGDPMLGAIVSVVRPLWRNGRSAMANVARKSTDDRGRFRFGNLAPGNYIVCAEGSRDASAPVQGPVDYATHVDNRFYARTCNRAFQLAPGQHAQVDVSPLTAAMATVRGHVRNLPPQTGFSVNLMPDDGSEGFNQINAFADAAQGTYSIRGVPPGRYRLRAQSSLNANGAQRLLLADLPVDVGSSDMDGLDVAFDSAGTVDVALHGVAENQIDAERVTVILRGAHAAGEFRGSTRDKDGAFHFDGVTPGSYRLSAWGPEESCVESVKLGGRDMRGVPFEVAAGAALHLDVAVSKNCGSIRMRAVRADAAVPGAKVVLLLSGTAKDPGELKEDFANDEGEYLFPWLTPGRYLVWAWAVEGTGAMAGPAGLAEVEPQATVVEVTAGDPVHVDVPLLKDEGKGQ
jgi:protocatechuate 3,4-dioxygenase beta subunit